MKKLLFLITIFCTITVNAQTYLISFAGTGESNTVGTVKVENLTAGTFLELNGNDILQLTVTTGINENEIRQSAGLKIYPNPMINYATLEINPSVNGDAFIKIYEITGKQVFTDRRYLENGKQEFLISGIKSGLYLINIKGKTYQYTGKLLCAGKSSGKINVEKVSNYFQTVDEKPLITENKGVQETRNMAYATGDRLKFTAVSGNYSTVLTEIPAQDKILSFNFIACTDAANNHYPVVSIGTQIWMARNLEYLPAVSPSSEGSESEKHYYVYNYQGTNVTEAKATSNYQVYGVLFNWPAANNGCPTGWHLPSDEEWTTLENYLIANGYNYDGTTSGNKIGKALAATTTWPPSTYTTGAIGNTNFPQKRNMTGFSALPGGQRYDDGGIFSLLNNYGYYWTSTAFSTQSYFRYLTYEYDGVYRYNTTMARGYSVRCIKN